MTDLKTLPANRRRDLWVNSGSLQLTPQTTIYNQGTIFQVDYPPTGKFDTTSVWGAILYCKAPYRVDDVKPEIDWTQILFSDIGRLTTAVNGVEVYHFEPLLTYAELQAIDSPILGINANDGYIPRDTAYRLDTRLDAKVNIDDDELMIILNEVGVPFLDIRELEYGRRDIIDLCIYPVLQEYYKYFPILKEEVVGSLSTNQGFSLKYPPNAYYCMPFYVMGAGSGGIGAGGTAFAFMSEQFMSGGFGGMSGGRFGRGVRYYGKPVPGYVGLNTAESRLRQMEAAQGFTNYFRREKYSRVKEDGSYYARGFSTTGGVLNVKWLLESPDWNDIDYIHLNEVRDLCTAKVMQSLGMLRALIAVDVAKIDFTLYTNRAKDLADPIKERWKTSPTNNILAIQRGGG